MWVLYALAASVVNAIYSICLQNVRLPAPVFMIYRGFIVALMVLPFLFCFEVIGAWQFYAIAIMQGLIVAYSDYATLNANRRYGAETVNSILPINVASTFILWCVIEPAIIYTYLHNPIKTAGIVVSMFGICYALSKYRRVKVTSEAFFYLIPVIISGSLIAVSNKTIMNYASNSLFGLCFWRIFVSSLTIGAVHLAVGLKNKLPMKTLVDKENLLKIWFLILMPMSMLCRNMAMFYADNPSYVSSIVQTSLLWIIFFNRCMPFIRFKRMYIQIEKKWAFLILICAIILIVSTN